MKAYLVKTPRFVARMFPKRIWAFPNTSKNIYLTFDDGPIPQVTPWVLDVLKEFQAKATFFCIGDNIKKHPKVFEKLIFEGHSVGNHTFHHLNGWKTSTTQYLNNVAQVQRYLPKGLLFRPPYGKIKSSQAKELIKKGYTIVMWDVLSADFDTDISEEKCLHNVLKHIKPGSIVVFHDSIKAEKKLKYTLPKVLEYISEKGWNCCAINVD
ncbi:MAG: polysaccharide deacetylase family protein [Bacteroidetes bacterium]|nr:polysaccharide deacetylase family protein [Bacteroidota bacterium]